MLSDANLYLSDRLKYIEKNIQEVSIEDLKAKGMVYSANDRHLLFLDISDAVGRGQEKTSVIFDADAKLIDPLSYIEQ